MAKPQENVMELQDAPTRSETIQLKHIVKPNTTMVINKCSHIYREYYAKGLCKKCYHQFGRSKLATACPHKNKPSQAMNMCVACYNRYKYARNKKLKNMEKPESLSED